MLRDDPAHEGGTLQSILQGSLLNAVKVDMHLARLSGTPFIAVLTAVPGVCSLRRSSCLQRQADAGPQTSKWNVA